MPSRRAFIGSSTAALAALAARGIAPAAARESLIGGIERTVLDTPPVAGGTWFHPRACRAGDAMLMTLQPITGNDFFGPVHWTTSTDLGATWSAFRPVPALGWVPLAAGGHEGVCDVTPEFHPPTGSVLALGHNVFYTTDRFDPDQPPRRPVYAVWKDGTWGPRKMLEWGDPRGSFIYTNNCGQRVTMPDGGVMMSFSFGTKGEPRRVCGVRCTFDGEHLAVMETGPAIENPRGRGLLEPSLTRFAGRFYLTLRAEDDRGYVAVSDDGLHYEPKRPWTWDDGEPLETSTTQQHWLQHAEGLFLVYVRKDVSNAGVFRWRAPLWLAQVDVATMRLVRATERVVLPLVGDGVREPQRVPLMGNFGVCAASPDESWVTDGSCCHQAGNTGELQLGRVTWTTPNLLQRGGAP